MNGFLKALVFVLLFWTMIIAILFAVFFAVRSPNLVLEISGWILLLGTLYLCLKLRI